MLIRSPTLSGAFLLVFLLGVGCANSPPMTGTGSGGAVGSSGGAVGSGGAPGSGGNTGGLILGGGGPFPFPQNKKPGNCLLTTVPNASAAAQAAYNSWKQAFVTSGDKGLRVRRPGNNDDTVSEGIGYGMIAAAYMADRTTFDGLWTYAQAHLDSHGLMNWHLNATGGILDAGSATDGDVDIVWGLILGSNQWSSQAYLTAAKTMIDNLSSWCIAPDGMLKPGDGWGGTPLTNPSYFAPSYFRVFAAVSGDANWKGVILDRNYAILAQVAGEKGLVPDWTNNSGEINKGSLMMPGNYDSSSYGYDATRTPWRVALDYCFNNEPRAKAYLDKIGAFFNGVGAANIGDKYSLSGQQQSSNKNMAFIGPAGVSGMAGFQSLVDGAFTYGNTNNGGDGAYFPQSLRVLTMLMMSGNFVDFTKPQ
jgi:endo-1,4-beta-D-glucanase Y